MVDDQPNIILKRVISPREYHAGFHRGVQKLPGGNGAVLLLCDVMGWSPSEAAEILDMTNSGSQ